MDIVKVIMKMEKMEGPNGETIYSPLVGFPELPANIGMMLMYVHEGQHSEGTLGYFQSCSPVDMSELTEEQAALKKEVEEAYNDYILEWV